jgi:hypothetical protein
MDSGCYYRLPGIAKDLDQRPYEVLGHLASGKIVASLQPANCSQLRRLSAGELDRDQIQYVHYGLKGKKSRQTPGMLSTAPFEKRTASPCGARTGTPSLFARFCANPVGHAPA